LRGKGLFLFDIEGVLCDHMDDPWPLPAARELLVDLKDLGKKVVLLTNIGRNSKREVLSKLERMGFSVPVITAGEATTRYILSEKPGVRVFVISEGGVLEDLRESGVEIVTEAPADFVVVGANRRVTYAELNQGMRLVLGGARLVCCGSSRIFRGRFLGDEGAFLGEAALAEAIASAAGVEFRIIGKPDPQIFHQALEIGGGFRPEEAVMFGDSLSDMEGAEAAGISRRIFLHRGREQRVPADLTFRDLEEFYAFWKASS
jgi:HAD superfamily hydrolase (TIGR01450 family)